MRTYMLLSEVEEFMKAVQKSLREQKRYYTYDEIVELEDKATKKYNSLYKKIAFKRGNLEGKKISAAYHKYIVMKYLKIVMEVTGSKNTVEIDIDIDELSLKVLEATDKLGYEKHMENKNKR